MPIRKFLPALLLLFTAVALESARAGDTRAIILDNDFSDWAGASADAVDPAGDVAPGEADFENVYIADDNANLFIRFTTARELVLLEPGVPEAGNALNIFIDGDGSAATGQLIDGIGVDLEVQIGPKTATFHDSGGSTPLSLNEIGFRGIPTHSGFEFEITIAFEATPGFSSTLPIITGPNINLFMREDLGGDRIPDSGAIAYSPGGAGVAPPPAIDFNKIDAGDIRIVSQNAENDALTATPAPFQRVYTALNPDIVNFQELKNTTAAQVVSFMQSILPAGPGEAWNAVRNNNTAINGDTVTVSRWPIVNSVELDGNLVVEVDPPDDRSLANLIVFNAHTPCCANNAGRDVEHDRISATWRDMLNGVGPFAIDPSSPVFMVGDFNMVGFVRQLETLRDGAIIDNGTFGPDFSPGRGNGSLVNVPLRHNQSRSTYTWRSDGSSFSPGKLDYILYSDDSATLKKDFALWTPDMDAGSLSAAGLQADDTAVMSDHLPLVADFQFAAVPVELSGFAMD